MASIKHHSLPFRHDWAIFSNVTRAVLASWGDCLALAVAVLFALAIFHVGVANQSFRTAALTAGGLGAATGLAAMRLIVRRLQFHRSDGALAAAALSRGAGASYAAAIHLIATGLLSCVILSARPGLIFAGLAGYTIGAASLLALASLTPGHDSSPRFAFGRTARALLGRPSAGGFAAVAVLVILLPPALDAGARMAFAGVLTLIAVVGISAVDYQVVRFLTIAGYASSRIIGLYARPGLIFSAAIVPPLFLVLQPETVAVVCIVTGALLLLTAMRILTYRVYPKRAADTIVGMFVAVLGLAGYMAPILLPLVIGAMLWRLYRQSASATWMLP